LVEYLQSFGINEELGIFVEHYSLEKEQKLYVNWLKNMQKFVGGTE